MSYQYSCSKCNLPFLIDNFIPTDANNLILCPNCECELKEEKAEMENRRRYFGESTPVNKTTRIKSENILLEQAEIACLAHFVEELAPLRAYISHLQERIRLLEKELAKNSTISIDKSIEL